MGSLASLRRRYTLFMYNLLVESLKRSLASFKEVHYSVYIYLCITCKWNPHEEFGISQKEVHFIYV